MANNKRYRSSYCSCMHTLVASGDCHSCLRTLLLLLGTVIPLSNLSFQSQNTSTPRGHHSTGGGRVSFQTQNTSAIPRSYPLERVGLYHSRPRGRALSFQAQSTDSIPRNCQSTIKSVIPLQKSCPVPRAIVPWVGYHSKPGTFVLLLGAVIPLLLLP